MIGSVCSAEKLMLLLKITTVISFYIPYVSYLIFTVSYSPKTLVLLKITLKINFFYISYISFLIFTFSFFSTDSRCNRCKRIIIPRHDRDKPPTLNEDREHEGSDIQLKTSARSMIEGLFPLYILSTASSTPYPVLLWCQNQQSLIVPLEYPIMQSNPLPFAGCRI